jgi:hypothetical protein
MKEAMVNFQKEQKRITDSIFEAQQSHINIHRKVDFSKEATEAER